jgi:hypothetical protein
MPNFRSMLAVVFVLTSCGFVSSQSSEKPWNRTIPFEEREILLRLYQATDGDHWKRRDGWGGPAGTECDWYGVRCSSKSVSEKQMSAPDWYKRSMTVVFLQLDENGLNGRIPEEVAQLADLKSLSVYKNHLTARLPNPLIQRWLSGQLSITVETSFLTDVSEVDFESSSSSVICATHRIILRSDSSALMFTERCRNASPRDRRTYCEVKKGRTIYEFAKLGWLLDQSDFYRLEPEYHVNVTDIGFERTRVSRNRQTSQVVNYGDAGPFGLWTIQRAIEGIASDVGWDKTFSQPKCPRWADGPVKP